MRRPSVALLLTSLLMAGCLGAEPAPTSVPDAGAGAGADGEAAPPAASPRGNGTTDPVPAAWAIETYDGRSDASVGLPTNPTGSPYVMGYPVSDDVLPAPDAANVLFEFRVASDAMADGALWLADGADGQATDFTVVASAKATPGEVGRLLVPGKTWAAIDDPFVVVGPDGSAGPALWADTSWTVWVTTFGGPVPDGFTAVG